MKHKILIFLLIEIAWCCLPGGRLSRRRVRSEPPLMLEEYVPSMPEMSASASGPVQAPIRSTSDFRYANLVEYLDLGAAESDVIFRDRNDQTVSRRMTRVS